LGLIFLVLEKAILARKITFKIYRQDIFIFIFLAVYFLSTLTAINPRIAFFGLYDSWTTSFLTFLVGFGFYVILINQIKTFDKAKELFLFVLAGASIACLTALWQYFEQGGALFPLEKIRVSGVLGQPNYLGFYLALALPFSLGLAFSQKSFLLKIIFGIISFLITLTFILTFSRTAWLAVILSTVAVLLLAILKFPKKRLTSQLKKNRGPLVIVILLTIIIFLAFAQPLVLRTKESFQAVPEQNTLLIRFYEWKGGLRVFKERPILGVGPENLYYLYGRHKDAWLNKIENEWFFETYSIRNIYIDLLVKNGLLGLVSFLGLLGFSLKRLVDCFQQFRKKAEFGLYLAVVSSFLIFLFFGIGYFLTPTSLIFFWLLLGLTRLLTVQNQEYKKIIAFGSRKSLLKYGAFGLVFLTTISLVVLLKAVAADYFAKIGVVNSGERRIKSLEKSISLNPLFSVYKRELAYAYVELATKSVDEGTSKITLKENGKSLAQKALSVSEEAILNDPYDPVNYTNLSLWYFRLSLADRGYLEKALWVAEKAREIQTNSPGVWDNAGLVFLDIGNREKAKAYFEQAISLKNNYAPSHFHLGETLRQMGRPEEALEHYQMFPGERAEQEIKETLLEIKKKGE
jgi:O-antigen ligase